MNTALLSRLTESDSLAVGVLGAGNIGTVHLKSALVMPGVDVRAVADARSENRARAKRAGVSRTYDDYATLLESEDLDAAVVALPRFSTRTPSSRPPQPASTSSSRTLGPLERGSRPDARGGDGRGIAVGVDHASLPARRSWSQGGLRGRSRRSRAVRVDHAAQRRRPRSTAGDGLTARWPLDADAAGAARCSNSEFTVSTSSSGCSATSRSRARRSARRSSCRSKTPRRYCSGRRRPRRRSRFTVVPTSGNSSRGQHAAPSRGRDGDDRQRGVPPGELLCECRQIRDRKRRRSGDRRRPGRLRPDVLPPGTLRCPGCVFDAIRNDERPPVDGRDGKRTLELAEAAYECAKPTGSNDLEATEVTL